MDGLGIVGYHVYLAMSSKGVQLSVLIFSVCMCSVYAKTLQPRIARKLSPSEWVPKAPTFQRVVTEWVGL